jgi:hypothetical protein
MNRSLGRASDPRTLGRCRAGVLLVAGVIGVAAAPAAEANPIRLFRTHPSASLRARPVRGWAAFLAGGPLLWSQVHAPPINLAVRRVMLQSVGGADPLANPMVQYLLWRHDLSPARFDFWHPWLGPRLEHLLPPMPTVIPVITSRSVTPPSDVPQPSPHPQVIPPPNTPEPGAVTIGLVLAGAFACWRRGRLPAAKC